MQETYNNTDARPTTVRKHREPPSQALDADLAPSENYVSSTSPSGSAPSLPPLLPMPLPHLKLPRNMSLYTSEDPSRLSLPLLLSPLAPAPAVAICLFRKRVA